MWNNRRFRLFAFLVIVFFAYLSVQGDAGVSAFGVFGPPEIESPAVAPENAIFREDNAYYRDCLRRRDAGDMQCGEVCYWRECMVCENVCTLDCPESYSCDCSCDDCPDPVPPKLEFELPVESSVSSGALVDEPVAVDEPAGVSERPAFQAPTPIPQLECTDYPSCIEEYEVEIEPIDGQCMDFDRMPVGVPKREDCLGGGNYWVAGDFYANYGLGADITDTGAYIQPFAFSWDVRFKNNYRGSGMPGIPATPTHLIDLYKFECEIRWTTLGGVPIPGVVDGGWPDKCVLGHNTLESRGFFADATECDELYNPGGGCNVTDNPPDAYRLWPIGSYKVEVLIDGEIIVQNVFSVTEFERPDPWPLDMPEERPENHGGRPVYYTRIGIWPSGLAYGADYYLNNLDCIEEELCSVVHPWEYPLPFGSSGGAYEVRPLWGDYSVPIGEPRSAPKPETHTGFDFVYPWCPRLDWCYQGQSGDPDPCVEDTAPHFLGGVKNCRPDSCPRYCPDPCSTCGPCDCGKSCGCSQQRSCAWVASCGGCTEWAWRSLGLIGSGAGRPAFPDFPLKYGAGFNVDNPSGNYGRLGPDGIGGTGTGRPSGTRGNWERDNTELFQMAEDVHMLVDNYLGTGARCQAIRDNASDLANFEDRESHLWARNYGPYSWLTPGPLRDARRPVHERISELGELSTALPAQARLDDSIKEPRECEVLLRSEIKESFLQSDIGSAFRSGASTEGLGTVDLNTPEFFAKLAAINAEVFAKVGEVFGEVKEECEDFSDVWDPVMTTSSVSRGGEDNFCPNLGSGAYPRGTTYLLMNGDRMPVTVDDIESILLVEIEPKKDAYGEYILTPNGRYVIDSVTDLPVTEIDFVLLKQSLVLHWEPGAEGSGLGGRGPSSSATSRGSILLGSGGPGSVGGSPMRGFAASPSGRLQPTLPVDDSRCWIYDEELSWRFFDVGRIADPPIEIRETELEWQGRIGWVHNPVASGNGPPPVGTPLVGMPLRLPDRSGYADWSLLDWFTFNSRRVVAGFPAVEIYSNDGGSTFEPREILVDRYGDRLWDKTVALPGSGVGAQGLRYYDRSLGGHATTGPRFQERFMGYVDTRPAPAFVISWPMAAVNPGLPYDGPVVGSGSYPDLPDSQGWYENFVDDYIERTNIHFKKVKPDIDHRSPGFMACNPDAAHNHVVGYGPGGRLAAVAAIPCWVTYRGAVRVPGIYQLATPSPASGMTPEKFPLYRIRDSKTGYIQPIRSSGELDDRDYRSAAYDARSCEDDGYGGCLEPGGCTYQDHRGMLKTNFTLQEYPQYIGESYEGKSQITGIEDFDGESYDSLLVVAKDSAQGEELDWYQPLKQAEWTFEHNVLDYKRREGFTYVYARLPWTGYRTLPNGYIEYTDRLGYNIEINPALLGGCHPLCPYLDERRIEGERMVTKRIRTHTQGGVTSKRYAFHLYGPLEGFAMSELEGAEGHLFESKITECRYFGDGKVECGNMGKYYGSQWEGDLPYGKLGFVYDMPYPYCPYLNANGMATMENYVVPPWSYVAPEDDLVMDDDPLVDSDRDRLVEFYNSTRGDYWINTTNWLSAMPLNEWHGVVAVGDRVVRLSLPRNGLSGSLPDRFGEMDQMLHLDLSHNLVGGRLPDSMYDMEVLENLNLADNRFRMGGIGLNDLFAKLLELKYLDLSYNRFYGGFPWPSKFVSEIESIIFSYSGFVNTLPEAYGPFGSPGNPQEDYAMLRPHLFRLELRGNVLDPRCVSNLLADNIPSNDVELLGRGLCD